MPFLTAQFVGGKGLASLAIELKGAGPYSHVDMVCDDGRLLGARSDECGGQPPGVRIRPQGYEEWNAIAQISIPCTDAQHDAAWAFWMAQIGKAYDKTAILAFVFGRDWENPEDWFCSELRAAGLKAAKVFPFDLITPANKVDPDMEFAIESTHGIVRLIKK